MKEEKKIHGSLGELITEEELPYPIPDIGKELMLYKELFRGKLVEYEDRKKILNLQRKGFKLFLFSTVVSLAVNRGFTLTKARSFDFMNLNFGIRMIVRLVAFSSCMYFFFYIPFLNDLFECRDGLNKKYYPRYQLFLKSRNFLIMNPNLLNDPELTQEEHSHYIQAIESIKMLDNNPKKNL